MIRIRDHYEIEKMLPCSIGESLLKDYSVVIKSQG